MSYKFNALKNASYSEIKISSEPNWNAEAILLRGTELLTFMEERWDINLGSQSEKLQLLNLSFLNENKEIAEDGEYISKIE